MSSYTNAIVLSIQISPLYREQTDELKGALQLGILVYHLTAAKRRLLCQLETQLVIDIFLFLFGFVQFRRLLEGNCITAAKFVLVSKSRLNWTF